ncbi:MAG: MBL fold metallo-hydrolase [Chloroflexi bacterium]|nr:MAG: MBL fold metallo-hydrolase [Chloroflexota bacterium]
MVAAKKPAAKKPVAKKKPAAKAKPAAKQPATRKPALKRPASKPAAKKAPARKPAAKKPTAKKPVAKKAPARKPAAKKPVAKKAPALKPAAEKPVPKTAVTKAALKPAAKKAVTKKAAAKETIESRVNVVNDHLTQHVVIVKQFTRTFPTSNVWVLKDGREAALLDAGYGDKQSIGERSKFFTSEMGHLDFKTIAMTHHHYDHSSGARQLRELLKAETAINPIDEVLLHTPPTPSQGNEDLPDEEDLEERVAAWRAEALATPIDRPLSDGETFRVGGLTVQAVHTPGHTAGHNCYWVEDLRILFTGDNILGVGTSAIGPPPAGDMKQYLDSLLRMRELQATLFAPGHGPTVTATDAKVQELLDHRATRDRQIIDLIDKGYATDRQIRRALYPEIQKGLRRAAGGQIRSHLAKMVGQGIAVVTQEDDGKVWRVALTK